MAHTIRARKRTVAMVAFRVFARVQRLADQAPLNRAVLHVAGKRKAFVNRPGGGAVIDDAVARAVQEISDSQAYSLLEALATAVADELLRRFGAEGTIVRVRKPAARPGGLDATPGVSVSRP